MIGQLARALAVVAYAGQFCPDCRGRWNGPDDAIALAPHWTCHLVRRGL